MSPEEKLGEHEARLNRLETDAALGRAELKADLVAIQSTLVAIQTQLAAQAARPSCPDPGACVRVEKALVDQNRRLTFLEAQENKRTGVIATIGIVCTLIGAGVSMLIAWVRK